MISEQHRQVALTMTERGGQTRAEASLDSGGRTYRGRGEAHCKPTDFDVPEVGEELAAGRALADLSARLVEAAASDIESMEGETVTLRP